MMDVVFLLIHNGIFGALASLGFALLFNVPKFALRGVAFTGFVAIFARTLLVNLGTGIEVATLISSAIVGFMGLYFYVRWNAPSSIFTVTGTIPMVPGTFAFKAMIGFVTLALSDAPTGDMAADAMRNLIKTALILGAIGVGIAAPSLIFKRFRMVM